MDGSNMAAISAMRNMVSLFLYELLVPVNFDRLSYRYDFPQRVVATQSLLLFGIRLCLLLRCEALGFPSNWTALVARESHPIDHESNAPYALATWARRNSKQNSARQT